MVSGSRDKEILRGGGEEETGVIHLFFFSSYLRWLDNTFSLAVIA